MGKLIYDGIFGPLTAGLILGLGLWVSLRTRFVQLRLLPGSLGFMGRQFRAGPGDGVSPFQAVCTCLGTTVGTGNIAGVAGAICLGGPGALFWMWVSGILGMGVKLWELTLAVRYRSADHPGPLGYLSAAFPPWVPRLYCFFGILGALGMGNVVQSATAASVLRQAAPGLNVPAFAVSLGLSVLAAVVLLGGAKRIGEVSELLIPFGAAAYILLCLGSILHWRGRLPQVLAAVFREAFQPRAAAGLIAVIRTGVMRGIFSNESGLGASSLAHGEEPMADQWRMGIFEVFADTLVICTLTGLAILVSPLAIPYGAEAPGLVQAALGCTYGPWVTVFLGLAIGLFCFATVLGWGLYGCRFAEGLTGSGRWFLPLHCAVCALGGILPPESAWDAAQWANALMALPNLLALWRLRGEAKKWLTNPKTVVE